MRQLSPSILVTIRQNQPPDVNQLGYSGSVVTTTL